MTKEEWLNHSNDDRKWPAVCKDWNNVSETDRIATDERPWFAQFKIDGDRTTV